ncbi:hypothetical protein DPMN_023931 [Dreissena polymorpha]|uniref:Uncharacterized protein n=1 Tax=Dreissena polymorpha TaxID=45954 RepID=A0A9D4LLK5_DREPO|nr:hypothetical protein DPMN_023931 [Dreissena polymorpha]
MLNRLHSQVEEHLTKYNSISSMEGSTGGGPAQFRIIETGRSGVTELAVSVNKKLVVSGTCLFQFKN